MEPGVSCSKACPACPQAVSRSQPTARGGSADRCRVAVLRPAPSTKPRIPPPPHPQFLRPAQTVYQMFTERLPRARHVPGARKPAVTRQTKTLSTESLHVEGEDSSYMSKMYSVSDCEKCYRENSRIRGIERAE